jgi:hypothetical protein
MDLKIITVIFLLANNQLEYKEYKINKPCSDWYNDKLVYVFEINQHFIDGKLSIGYYCGVIKTTPK